MPLTSTNNKHIEAMLRPSKEQEIEIRKLLIQSRREEAKEMIDEYARGSVRRKREYLEKLQERPSQA
jgi:CRISPR/Cas system-associated protein Cas10 (large subunit of type III CRISPR-Cas system)